MRSAKESNFPYRMDTVCYFEVYKDGTVNHVPHKNKSDLNNVLEAIKRSSKGITTLYAVWPGNWRSDLFIIDDLEEMAKSFELVAI